MSVEDVTPAAAWDALRADPDAMLVDVRTDAEWNFVGLPDLGEAGKQLASSAAHVEGGASPSGQPGGDPGMEGVVVVPGVPVVQPPHPVGEDPAEPTSSGATQIHGHQCAAVGTS